MRWSWSGERLVPCPHAAPMGPPVHVLVGGDDDVARRTSSMVSGEALAAEPLSKGGCGSYSMPSWIALATSSPAIWAASHRAMSIPADPPAAGTIPPA